MSRYKGKKNKTVRDHAGEAAEALANLNIFAAVVGLMESGCVLGYSKYAERIIHIAQVAQQVHLREYDRALAAAEATPASDGGKP